MERLTRQRRAVLDALSTTGRTLSPAEMLDLARQSAPGLNLSTVYRQIRALESDGEIIKVELPGQPARYELPCSHDHHAPAQKGVHEEVDVHEQQHHHHHFHCTCCESVVPIHGCPGDMQNLAPTGFRVETHDLVLHGRCATCVEKGGP